MAVQLLERYHRPLLDRFWWRTNAGHTIYPNIRWSPTGWSAWGFWNRYYRYQHIRNLYVEFSSVVLILNFASAAIILKICRNAVPGRRMQHALRFAIRVFTESGLIYTLTTIFVLCAVYIRDSPSGSEYPLFISCDIVRRQAKWLSSLIHTPRLFLSLESRMILSWYGWLKTERNLHLTTKPSNLIQLYLRVADRTWSKKCLKNFFRSRAELLREISLCSFLAFLTRVYRT